MRKSARKSTAAMTISLTEKTPENNSEADFQGEALINVFCLTKGGMLISMYTAKTPTYILLWHE